MSELVAEKDTSVEPVEKVESAAPVGTEGDKTAPVEPETKPEKEEEKKEEKAEEVKPKDEGDKKKKKEEEEEETVEAVSDTLAPTVLWYLLIFALDFDHIY